MKTTASLTQRTRFIALTRNGIAIYKLGSSRVPINIASTVLAVGLLSGCVTSQIQSTLNEASKIETECEAVDNSVSQSGQTWTEFQDQLVARLLPADCSAKTSIQYLESCLSVPDAFELPTTLKKSTFKNGIRGT